MVDGDGTWRLTSAAQSNTTFSGDVTIYTGGTTPGFGDADFQASFSEQSVRHVSTQAMRIGEYAVRPFPYYALSYAQQDIISPLQMKIGRYVDTCIAMWVLGEMEISDETFAQFEQQLADYGLNDFMAFWQEIYDTQCKK